MGFFFVLYTSLLCGLLGLGMCFSYGRYPYHSSTLAFQTFTFGALLNRDEVFYSIVCVGKRAQLNWAKDPELIPRRHSLEN